MVDIKNLDNLQYYEQLALGIEISEDEKSEDGYVSPEEARRRNESARKALGIAGIEEPPTWFEQYHQLLNSGFPWRVACYIAWAASPKLNRWPKTQDELAREVLGLTSDRQIATWRRNNPAIDDLISLMQAIPLMEFRADMFHALTISASDPDHRHNPDRKLMAEMTGDYTPKVKVESDRNKGGDLSDKSDAELERIAGVIKNNQSGDDQINDGKENG